MILRVKKCDKDARLPERAHDTDAGFDLFASQLVVVKAGETASVPTGLAIAVPKDHVGLIWDKSGLALKHGLTVLGGVIDEAYTGQWLILIHNLGKHDYTFAKHDKVAQFLIQEIVKPTCEIVEELCESDRGEAGFGSTGQS